MPNPEAPELAPPLAQPLTRFTFYPDYDDLTRLTTLEQKVAYLEGRVRRVLIRPLLRMQVLRSRGELRDINLIAVSAICSGIEALSHFYRGGKGKGHFVEFCRHYMPTYRRRDPRGRSYAALLYDNFRSALSHGFTIEEGRLELGGHHGRANRLYGLELDPWELFREFETALVRYLQDARTDPDLSANFEKRFDAIFRHWTELARRRTTQRASPTPEGESTA